MNASGQPQNPITRCLLASAARKESPCGSHLEAINRQLARKDRVCTFLLGVTFGLLMAVVMFVAIQTFIPTIIP